MMSQVSSIEWKTDIKYVPNVMLKWRKLSMYAGIASIVLMKDESLKPMISERSYFCFSIEINSRKRSLFSLIFASFP